MSGFAKWGLTALAGVFLCLGIGAGPAAAEGDCKEECGEARRICHRATHAARVACVSECHDAIGHAIERARHVCETQSLEPEQCLALVREAVRAAGRSCRADCRSAYWRARARCGEEVRECAAACEDHLDPDCALDCREDFVGCRDDLEACRADCAEDRREAVAQCFHDAANVSDPDGLRVCLRQAFQENRRCVHACHDELPCGSDALRCLRGCVIN